MPAKDPIANGLRSVLPDELAYRVTRRINIARQRLIYSVSMRYPRLVRRLIRAMTSAAASGRATRSTRTSSRATTRGTSVCASFPTATCSRPSRVARPRWSPTASRDSPRRGILLESGRELEADIIVTATGLNLLAFGGMELVVDGEPVERRRHAGLQEHDAQRRAELRVRDRLHQLIVDAEGRPRSASTCAGCSRTWTRPATTTVVPVADDPTMSRRPLLDFAGRIRAARDRRFPKQGSDGPWTVEMSYAADRARLRNGSVDDTALRFGISNAARREVAMPELVTA